MNRLLPYLLLLALALLWSSSFAAITPEGRKRLRKAAPVYLAAIEQHFLAHLDEDEIEVLARALTKVLRAEES